MWPSDKAEIQKQLYYFPNWLLFFALFKFLLQFLFLNPEFELHRDEYLYLAQANHLAWGFLEVPPALSIQALITKWLGNGLFWVKFWPALFGALTVYVIGKIVRALNGGLFALSLASITFIFSAYLRLNQLFQPNSLDILLWTIYFYLIIRYIQSNHHQYVLYLGVFLGIGLFNKYTVGFFIVGAFVALILTEHRRLFARPVFYLSLLLALLIILPNIWWQYQHNIPFLQHMQELQKTQLVHVKVSDFLVDQIIICFSAIVIWPVGLIALLSSVKYKAYRVIGYIFLLVMALFLVLHGKSYYTLGLYPVLIAFGSVFWETWTRKITFSWLRPILIVIPLALLLPLFPIILPVLSPAASAVYAAKFRQLGILRWEDGTDHLLPQDYADMVGWQELTKIVATAYKQIPVSERQSTIILCDNYGQAGAIDYYGAAYNLPKAYSENASYLLWLPQPLYFKHVILVGEEPDPEDRVLFRQVQKIGSITNTYAREKGTKVMLLWEADSTIVAKVNNRIQKERAKFE